MNLLRKRVPTVSVIIVLMILFIWSTAYARVYVYEVTTAQTRFQTASKLPPDAFLMYNGGFDVIYDLKVVATYADKDMAKALRDFNLEKNNSNMLLFTPIPDKLPRRPFYWWR